MLTMKIQELTRKAEELYEKLDSVGSDYKITIDDEYSEVGGGAMPLHKLPTKVISIYSERVSANELDKRLRAYKTPIITRILKDKILIDIRTVREDEYGTIVEALKAAL